MVGAVIYGARVKCFPSENGRQVIFQCTHPNALTRSAAVVLVKQFIYDHLNGITEPDFGRLNVIAIANEKGGVAKTASCVNLAASIVMAGRRVLLIDLDPQANATLNLGQTAAEPSSQPEKLLSDPTYPLNTAIVPTIVPGLDLIPAGPSLQNANHTLVSAVGRELKLRTKLVRWLEDPGSESYDFVMIDSPPAADILTLNALMAASYLIVPVQASYYSLRAMSRLAGTLDALFDALHPGIQLLGILLTMYDDHRPSQRAILELLRDRVLTEFGQYVFETAVRYCPEMQESEAYQRPVSITHPESDAADAYHKIADEILDRLERGIPGALAVGRESIPPVAA